MPNTSNTRQTVLFPLPMPPVMPILIILVVTEFDFHRCCDRNDFQIGYFGGDAVLQGERGDFVSSGGDGRRGNGDVVAGEGDRIFAGGHFVEQDLVADAFDAASHRIIGAVDLNRDIDFGGVRITQFDGIPQNKRHQQQHEEYRIAETPNEGPEIDEWFTGHELVFDGSGFRRNLAKERFRSRDPRLLGQSKRIFPTNENGLASWKRSDVSGLAAVYQKSRDDSEKSLLF